MIHGFDDDNPLNPFTAPQSGSEDAGGGLGGVHPSECSDGFERSVGGCDDPLWVANVDSELFLLNIELSWNIDHIYQGFVDEHVPGGVLSVARGFTFHNGVHLELIPEDVLPAELFHCGLSTGGDAVLLPSQPSPVLFLHRDFVPSFFRLAWYTFYVARVEVDDLV